LTKKLFVYKLSVKSSLRDAGGSRGALKGEVV